MKLELRLTDWNFEPTVNGGFAVLVALYILAWRKGFLRSNDDVSPWLPSARLRPWLFGLSIVAAVLALDSPVDEAGDSFLFWMHMIQHLLLMMVAPPLALLAICGARPLPPEMGRRLRATWTLLTRPWSACLIFNAVMLAWHVPALYNATLTTLPIHIIEHITFIVAGVIFWWPVVDPIRDQMRAGVSPLTRIAMLAVAGVPPTLLGLAFVSATAAIYPFYTLAPRLWGFSAVSDQQLAGVLMMGVGNVIYFVAIALIFVRIFGDPAADEAAATGRAA